MCFNTVDWTSWRGTAPKKSAAPTICKGILVDLLLPGITSIFFSSQPQPSLMQHFYSFNYCNCWQGHLQASQASMSTAKTKAAVLHHNQCVGGNGHHSFQSLLVATNNQRQLWQISMLVWHDTCLLSLTKFKLNLYMGKRSSYLKKSLATLLALVIISTVDIYSKKQVAPNSKLPFYSSEPAWHAGTSTTK